MRQKIFLPYAAVFCIMINSYRMIQYKKTSKNTIIINKNTYYTNNN